MQTEEQKREEGNMEDVQRGRKRRGRRRRRQRGKGETGVVLYVEWRLWLAAVQLRCSVSSNLCVAARTQRAMRRRPELKMKGREVNVGK